MDVKLLTVNEHVAGDVGPPGPPGNHAIYMRVFFVTSNTHSRCTVLDQSSRSSDRCQYNMRQSHRRRRRSLERVYVFSRT